ncbi:phosphomevalonate kinase [Candidatus Hodarchaeum mangrovi]
MITLSAPGKLMLSGEWSVLEKNVPCIVLAVDQRVKVSIEASEFFQVILEDFKINSRVEVSKQGIKFDIDNPHLDFTRFSMETAFKYLQEKNIPFKPFKLFSTTDIETVKGEGNNEMKVGFGSSAAAVIAIIGSILYFHNAFNFSFRDKELLFKLGIIAHYYGQGKLGSGFDVAASTFGGALVYKRFDPEWLQQELSKKSLLDVLYSKWPILEHWNIKIPKNLELMVGFTGVSASTRKLVCEMKKFRKTNLDSYQAIISAIKKVTEDLIEEFQTSSKPEKIIALLDKNRILLEELSLACSCHLEIQPHQLMSSIASRYGAVAKFSGAGGGDCSIGVSFDKKIAKTVLSEWEQHGIRIINIDLTMEGIRIEKD